MLCEQRERLTCSSEVGRPLLNEPLGCWVVAGGEEGYSERPQLRVVLISLRVAHSRCICCPNVVVLRLPFVTLGPGQLLLCTRANRCQRVGREQWLARSLEPVLRSQCECVSFRPISGSILFDGSKRCMRCTSGLLSDHSTSAVSLAPSASGATRNELCGR